jgi:hypothetical protein
MMGDFMGGDAEKPEVPKSIDEVLNSTEAPRNIQWHELYNGWLVIAVGTGGDAIALTFCPR